MTQLASRIVTLHPGDVAIGHRGDTLETLLGSCVAIVLTDPRRTIGSMCHIVHTSSARRAGDQDRGHAETALDRMCCLLAQRGINAAMCEAYVYGGGNMFPRLVSGPGVGDTNARWVLEALQRMRVRILHVDVGGAAYRHLSWTVGPEAPRTRVVPI
jgi:chemotaxis protein CheD